MQFLFKIAQTMFSAILQRQKHHQHHLQFMKGGWEMDNDFVSQMIIIHPILNTWMVMDHFLSFHQITDHITN